MSEQLTLVETEEDLPELPPHEEGSALLPPEARAGFTVLAALLAFGVTLLVVLAFSAQA